MRGFRPSSLLKQFRRSLLPRLSPCAQTPLSLKPFSLVTQNPSQFNPSFFLHNNFTYLSYTTPLRSFSTSQDISEDEYETEEPVLIGEEWEEEDEAEPEIDGGAGGGVVLQNVPWGEQALSIAHEVLKQFGGDFKLFSFKTTPDEYIYLRLDKLTHEYGCPTMEEVESFSQQYMKRLEEEGSKGHVPKNLGLEVSSPGADRLLRVPDELHRFKDFPMVVTYTEGDTETKTEQKTQVFFLDSIETETEHCVWRLADVKENRDPEKKGRPMSRKQKDWRLRLPYSSLKKVTFYIEY